MNNLQDLGKAIQKLLRQTIFILQENSVAKALDTLVTTNGILYYNSRCVNGTLLLQTFTIFFFVFYLGGGRASFFFFLRKIISPDAID
jgi:hypothetical protein